MTDDGHRLPEEVIRAIRRADQRASELHDLIFRPGVLRDRAMRDELSRVVWEIHDELRQLLKGV